MRPRHNRGGGGAPTPQLDPSLPPRVLELDKSQSNFTPSGPHLCACVGMDCNPRVQGISGPFLVAPKHGGCCRPGPNPRGGDHPPHTDPKTVAQDKGFCGRRRRQTFCFSLTAGVNFRFHHMCLHSKCSDFSGDLKYAKNIFLPIYFPLQISPPTLSVGDRAVVT